MNDEHLNNLELLLKEEKVEEVRLVYLKGYYDPKMVVESIYNLLKSHPDVLFKVIRMHSRGLPKERLKLLKGSIPSTKDFEQVKLMVEEFGFNKLIFIN